MHALLDDDDDNAMIIVNELCYPVEKLRIGEDKGSIHFAEKGMAESIVH